MHEKFGLQNVQSIELGKKVSSGVRCWAHWIVRVQPLPLMKRLVGFGELKVVHLPVPLIEQHGLRAAQSDGTERRYQNTDPIKHGTSVDDIHALAVNFNTSVLDGQTPQSQAASLPRTHIQMGIMLGELKKRGA